jgi:tetratricopeptide (TPR) repeat protein
MAGDLAEAHANCEQALSIGKYPPTMLVMAKIEAFEGLPAQTRSYVDQYNRLTRKGLVQRPMTELGFAKSHDFHWDPLLSDNFQNGYLIMALTLNLPKQAGRQRSYCHQGRADAKLVEAQNALSLYPDDYWLVNEVGLLQLESGQYDGAEANFKKVLQLAPNCHIALCEIACAFAHDGKTSEAASAICEFHRLNPASPVPDYLIELAKSIPADKLPAPLIPEPGPANGEAGHTQIPSGF